MGLDNGIMIKINREHREKFSKMIPSEINIAIDNYIVEDVPFKKEVEFEVAYWRKCWNIREILISYGTSFDEWLYFYTKEDLKHIWNDINYINTKKNWDTSESIWTFKEVRDNNDQILMNLEWIIDNWDALAALGVEVYAYDSY